MQETSIVRFGKWINAHDSVLWLLAVMYLIIIYVSRYVRKIDEMTFFASSFVALLTLIVVTLVSSFASIKARNRGENSESSRSS